MLIDRVRFSLPFAEFTNKLMNGRGFFSKICKVGNMLLNFQKSFFKIFMEEHFHLDHNGQL